MSKRWFKILAVSIMLGGLSGRSMAAQDFRNIEGEGKMEELISSSGNLIFNREKEFKNGKMENMYLNENGELELKPDKSDGIYLSPEIESDNFNELVASWNVETPEKTNIELSVQARIEGEWTIWYSYGKWSSNKNSGSVRAQSDSFSKLSIDTLEILSGKYADGIRYKVELKREDKNLESPRVKAIYMTIKKEKEETLKIDDGIEYLRELDVPARSQMIVPEIGNRICSPTSLAMVMEYYGLNMDTEEVAGSVIDNEVDIYGNWSYNASYAGSRGFDAYVARFTSVDRIKEKIAEGIPVIASIKTKSKNTLLGAPQTYPSGHLLVVRGFKLKDGEEYIIVNDPASPEVENVRREYKLSGFETAWSNMVYIISSDRD